MAPHKNPWLDPGTRDAMLRGMRKYVERGDVARQDPAYISGILDSASMPEPNSGCLLWLRRTGGGGYGRITINRRVRAAHRVAFEVAKGPIPEGMTVCHKCDVPCCINPDHLWLGTNGDNNADCNRKGRRNAARGETHCRAKLTEAQVVAIRADDRTKAEIAKAYGVRWCTIHHIKLRRKWRHL